MPVDEQCFWDPSTVFGRNGDSSVFIYELPPSGQRYWQKSVCGRFEGLGQWNRFRCLFYRWFTPKLNEILANWRNASGEATFQNSPSAGEKIDHLKWYRTWWVLPVFFSQPLLLFVHIIIWDLVLHFTRITSQASFVYSFKQIRNCRGFTSQEYYCHAALVFLSGVL